MHLEGPHRDFVSTLGKECLPAFIRSVGIRTVSNVNEDPFERNNLALTHREQCLQAVYILNQWHDAMMKSMECAVDPLWTVIREGGRITSKAI
jgi:hypothetical protein